MDKTNFDLEATSAAILFHQDMSTELILPKMGDEEQVDFEANQNLFIAMAIVSLLDDAGFREYVGTKLNTMFETAEALNEDVVECSPTSCAGGCCGKEEEDPGDGS